MDGSAEDGGLKDATTVDAGDPCNGFVFGWPERITELNTPENDWTPEMRADQLEIFWGLDQKLYSASRESVDEPFSNIGPVPNVDGDGEPSLLDNGLVLYYVESGSVYRTERTALDSPFSNSRRVEIENLDGQIYGIHVTNDEKTLYISIFDGSDFRIHVAERSNYQLPFANLRVMSELHKDGLSRGAPMLRGNRLLYFVDNQIAWAERTGPGPEDFQEVGWLALSEVNGAFDPWLSPDGRTLVFAGGSDFDIWTTQRICE